MNNTFNEYEELVFHKFAALCEYGYTIAGGVSTSGMNFDLMIRKDDKTYAVGEMKKNAIGVSGLVSVKSKLIMCARRLNARFIIVTEGDIYHIQDLIQGEPSDFDRCHTFDELFQIFLNASVLLFNVNDHVCQVRKILQKYGIKVGLRVGSLLYDSKWNTVSFTPIIEKNLFDKVVGRITDGEVYRFSSLETLFATLKNESFQMVALEGMNDKEDGDFLWKSLYGYDANIEEYKKQDETVYIMSCTNAKEDNLNMWRLYANDTSGMCMKLKVQTAGLSNRGFELAQVVYSDNRKLKCLQEIIAYFRDLPMHVTFILQQWNVWRAYFKNADYSVENEVRLLYLKSRDSNGSDDTEVESGWMLTNDCKVFSEYVTFKNSRAEKFPLKIENIILGPNSPERETNKKQITNMLRARKKLLASPNVDSVVSVSAIKSYRTGKK